MVLSQNLHNFHKFKQTTKQGKVNLNVALTKKNDYLNIYAIFLQAATRGVR